MKAIVQRAYGGPEVLEVREVETPTPGDGEVLVRVHAAAVNAGDCFTMLGSPWMVRFVAGFPKPKGYIPGFDVAGVVESVGSGVSRVQPGDEVIGECKAAHAEYASAKEERWVPKPETISFEEAAAVPTTGATALRGLRDAGKLQAGQHALINGASGGVGTFAVQIAKVMGAEVTGVCSGRNAEMVRSIGADHVIDYTQEDFTAGGPRYDLILDNVANRKLSEYKAVLKPDGLYVPNSGNGGMRAVAKAGLASVFSRNFGAPFLGTPKPEDLVQLGEYLESGTIKPVLDRTYPLDEARAAFGYVAEGHAAGKVVLVMGV
jgi:NADPH:quinone reductase-like Zn-dependent oxidoreductase